MVVLLRCPFCGDAMMFRKALWPSDGCVDAIIHARPGKCGIIDFSDGTTNETIIDKWNARSAGLAQRQQEPLAWAVLCKSGGPIWKLLEDKRSVDYWAKEGFPVQPLYTAASDSSTTGNSK